MADENSSISDFSQLTAGRYDQLTKSEKRIANYLRKKTRKRQHFYLRVSWQTAWA
jgi:DNA-binding MurR/RpiR family transcriptional regulator